MSSDNTNLEAQDGTFARSPKVRASSTHPSRITTAGKKRILIVDDSRLLCKALSRELRRAGFESVTANSGWTALTLAEQDHFDLVITDPTMPSMSGEELIERLRRASPDLPCLILTGKDSGTAQKVLARLPNVAGVVTKPWDYDKLITAANSAIAASNSGEARGPKR